MATADAAAAKVVAMAKNFIMAAGASRRASEVCAMLDKEQMFGDAEKRTFCSGVNCHIYTYF